MRSSAALRRISDLAVHIAEVVERRSPREVLPARVRPLVTAIVEAVARVTHTAATTIRDGLEPEPELRCLDDKVDELHRKLLQQLTVEESGLTPDVTVDLALLGRYFERIGDQAVNAAVWRLDPVRTAPAQ